MELVKINPEDFGLAKEKAHQIELQFAGKISEREELAKVYENIIGQEMSQEVCERARELRLQLVKVRTGINKIHKAEKAFYLAGGKFVDAWKNKNIIPIVEMEDTLKGMEEYYINLELERVKKLGDDRKLELSKYLNEECHPDGLGGMTDQIWDNYIIGVKNAYIERKKEEARLEKERIQNEKKEKLYKTRLFELNKYSDYEPIFELTKETNEKDYEKIIVDLKKQKSDYEEKQEKIRLENEKLKKEAEEKEKQRLAQEKIRLEKENKERLDREAKEAAEKAKHEAELKKIRDEKLRLEKIENDRIEKEKAEKAKQKAAEQKLKNAPDKIKLEKLINDISSIELPNVSGLIAQNILENVSSDIFKTIEYIKKSIEKM